MAKLFVLAVCALIGITSGASVKPNFSRFIFKIVGGFQADITEVPYQVSLQRNGRHHCGGSIIGERWILTAAHCMENPDTKIYTVRVGSPEHAYGGRLISVKAIHDHPEFDDENYNFDFSLLQLGEALEFDDTVKSIDLVEREPADGDLSLVSGWGVTQSYEENSDNLRAVVVPLVNRAECEKANRNEHPVTEAMICAGYLKEGGKDACKRDSGGPLVVKGHLAGVVSWGRGCAQPGYPGVYANVAYVREWIREVASV